MSIACLIIDDEPIARSILEKYIHKSPGLSLVGSLDNAIAAIPFLKAHEVDLIFLDINMPEFTGIDFLKSMRNPPKVIITTAYSEYGAESYEYEVVDYLMKPIPFERFLKAIQKVENLDTPAETPAEKAYIFLKEDQQTHRVDFDMIRYVQAYGNYLKVYTEDRMYMVRKTISDMEKESVNHLVRIHKSYLLSISHMHHVAGNEVTMIGGEIIPVGKVYRKDFEAALS